jgi:glycosyltransferase involved in cell wall biosynthesis
MDICVLNPFFYPYNGGTEKVLLEVYKRLARKHNITVLSAVLYPGDKKQVEEIFGIRVVRLPSKYFNIPMMPLPFVQMKGLQDAIKRTRADIYHINNRYQFFSNNVRAVRSVGGKVAITIHNSRPKNIGVFTDGAGFAFDVTSGRLLMSDADLITGISRNTITTTVPRRYHRKSHVVYNGVDFTRFCPRKENSKMRSIRKQLSLADNVILHNGRLVPQKGQRYLMRAFSRFHMRRKDDYSLLIIGRGYLYDYLAELATKLDITDRFQIISGISEEDLPLYYNIASVFVMPSTYEPASVALLEGLSSGVPTIASKVGGIPEMMKDGGIYVRPRKADDIERQLHNVFSGKVDVGEKINRGRKIIIKEHNWDDIAKEYERLFEETVKR